MWEFLILENETVQLKDLIEAIEAGGWQKSKDQSVAGTTGRRAINLRRHFESPSASRYKPDDKTA